MFSKVLTLNQNVEILKKKIQEQEVELEKLSTKKKTTTQKVDNLSAEEF